MAIARKNRSHYIAIKVDFNEEPEMLRLDPGHPGPKNNALIADEILKYIEERGFIKK